MIAAGRDYVTMGWWVAFFPGLTLSAFVVSLNLIDAGFAMRWVRNASITGWLEGILSMGSPDPSDTDDRVSRRVLRGENGRCQAGECGMSATVIAALENDGVLYNRKCVR
jgi:hypothetical protein